MCRTSLQAAIIFRYSQDDRMYEIFRLKVSEIEQTSSCVFVIDSSKTVQSATANQKQYNEVFK